MMSFQLPFESGLRAVAGKEDDIEVNTADECQGIAALTMHQGSLTVFAANDNGLVAYWHLNDNLSQIAAKYVTRMHDFPCGVVHVFVLIGWVRAGSAASMLEQVNSLACVEDLLIAGCSNGEVQILRIVFEKPGKSRWPALRHMTTISDERRWQLSIRTVVAHRTPDGEAILIGALQGDTCTLWRYDISIGSSRQVRAPRKAKRTRKTICVVD
jgi:hypothetical protein